MENHVSVFFFFYLTIAFLDSLCFARVARSLCGCNSLNFGKVDNSRISPERFRTQALEDTTRRMTYREMNMILRHEGGEDGLPVDCCPTVEEMVEPVGGRNRENMYVQLYRDGQNAQRFFEYSCRPDVLDKPCRFIDRKFTNQSRCVQKFSYTYAIIENSGSTVRNVKWSRSTFRELHFLLSSFFKRCESLTKVLRSKNFANFVL